MSKLVDLAAQAVLSAFPSFLSQIQTENSGSKRHSGIAPSPIPPQKASTIYLNLPVPKLDGFVSATCLASLS